MNLMSRPRGVAKVAANHFDPYFDPLFPQMLAHQLKFLRR